MSSIYYILRFEHLGDIYFFFIVALLYTLFYYIALIFYYCYAFCAVTSKRIKITELGMKKNSESCSNCNHWRIDEYAAILNRAWERKQKKKQNLVLIPQTSHLASKFWSCIKMYWATFSLCRKCPRSSDIPCTFYLEQIHFLGKNFQVTV